MKLIESILTNNPFYTAGRKITVKGIMLHSVGCPQPSASVFVKNWNKSTYTRACVHAFIDGKTGDVYQTLPWDHRGGHGGGSSNNTHIGVEMCEPSTIKYTGGANWVETGDGTNTKATVLRTYKAAVELFAMLCKKYSLDPMKPGVIISHKEGVECGISGGSHTDPDHIWSKFGLTMNQFRKDVKATMNGNVPVVTVPGSTGTAKASKLTEDGRWGKATTKRLQQIFGTTADGVVSNQWASYKGLNPGLVSGWGWQAKPNGKGSQLIKAMQKWAGMAAGKCDGEIGPETIKAFQKKLGTPVDGKVSNPSQMVKALQKWANNQ